MTAKKGDNAMSAGVDASSSRLDMTSMDKKLPSLEGFDVKQPTYPEKNRGERVAEMLIRAKAELLASGHFLTSDDLALRLNMDANGLRAWLVQAETQLRIFSVEHEGHVFYPDYAFLTGGNGNLILGLQDILTVLHTERNGWDMAFWFRSPNTFLGGKRPEDLLDRNLENVVFAAQQEISSLMP